MSPLQHSVSLKSIVRQTTDKGISNGIQIVAGFVFAVSLAVGACGATNRESLLERNKDLVRRMIDELWNKGNLEMVDGLFSADFIRHFLPDGSEFRGLDDLRARVRSHREAFPDWNEEIQRIVAEGDLVVIHFVSTGTNKGSWLGNPPTGKRVRINEVTILRIADGRIAEQWLMPDIYSLRQQLGLSGP